MKSEIIRLLKKHGLDEDDEFSVLRCLFQSYEVNLSPYFFLAEDRYDLIYALNEVNHYIIQKIKSDKNVSSSTCVDILIELLNYEVLI